jgi:hypothetical protein
MSLRSSTENEIALTLALSHQNDIRMGEGISRSKEHWM